MLFTFPLRYWFAIGDQEYLALEGGPPSFPPDSPCPMVLRSPPGATSLSPTGLSPSAAVRSRLLQLETWLVTPRHLWGDGWRVLQPLRDIGPQATQSRRFGLFPFRSPLLRESRLISFPRGTEMFQFPRLPSSPHDEDDPGSPGPGFPIRAPPAMPARRLTGAFRSLAAPFIGSWSLGIHREP